MDYGAHEYLYMRRKYLTIPWGDLLLFIAVYSDILPVNVGLPVNARLIFQYNRGQGQMLQYVN